MSEENIKKAEELEEAAELSEAKELSDAELDGAAGGAFGHGIVLKVVEKERQAAAALAQMEGPACKNR